MDSPSMIRYVFSCNICGDSEIRNVPRPSVGWGWRDPTTHVCPNCQKK